MFVKAQACSSSVKRFFVDVSSKSKEGDKHQISGLIIEGRVSCSCHGFLYRGHCSHLVVVDEECGWREDISGLAQKEKGKCPVCGSPTVYLMLGLEKDKGKPDNG